MIIRFIQILFFVGRGVLYGLFLFIKRRDKDKTNRKSIQGKAILFTLEGLGPTFIKLGQILASRPDLIGMEVSASLSKLQTQVHPIPSHIVINLIEASFSQPIHNLFTDFTQQPIACGSIAQVHKAKSLKGRIVAVKVKKNGLEITIQKDFKVLYWIAKWVVRFNKYSNIPLHDILSELENAILAQLDFKKEIKNAQQFQKNFREHTNLKIPKMIPELCNDGVITMEFIEGLNSNQLLYFNKNEKSTLALSGLKMLYKMIFVDGFIHADLHLGNISFQKNRLVLIDFGLITVLPTNLRNEFREFFFAMAMNNGALCAKIIQETAQAIPSDFNAELFAHAFNEKLRQFSGQAVLEFEVAQFAAMLFEIQQEFGIRGSTNFTMTIVALLMFEGVLKQVDPEMDFQGFAIKFLLSLKETEYTQRQRALVHKELRNSIRNFENS